MSAKKKLIARMATWTGVALGLAAVVGGTALVIDHNRYQRHLEENKVRQQQRVEEARAYLAGLAKRIASLPVDPTLASEIESHYFEQRAGGPVYVWALDTKGDFVFGVPQYAFNKLNAIYDREVTPRLKEGVLLDRQSFLLGLVDDADEIDNNAQAEERARVGRDHWRVNRWEPGNAFVVSTPLKTSSGAALGSLYLKRRPANNDGYESDDRLKLAMIAPAILATLSFIFLWILLPTWVYVDARERGVPRAPLFAFLTVLSSLVGLVVYLIARPEHGRTLTCPGCAREVNGGAFCPHCGRDLSRSLCPACRYPLLADWAYGPSCRTEIKSQAVGTPVPEAG